MSLRRKRALASRYLSAMQVWTRLWSAYLFSHFPHFNANQSFRTTGVGSMIVSEVLRSWRSKTYPPGRKLLAESLAADADPQNHENQLKSLLKMTVMPLESIRCCMMCAVFGLEHASYRELYAVFT